MRPWWLTYWVLQTLPVHLITTLHPDDKWIKTEIKTPSAAHNFTPSQTEYRSSSCPISLINVDIKIIAPALIHRIEKVTPSISHLDQSGFIKGRLASINTHRLFYLMCYTSIQQEKKNIIAALNAEKALDRVSWKFLFSTLERFGFGESFIIWIKVLCTSPHQPPSSPTN